MALLVIDWSAIGIRTLQFILCISIIVGLHELGHFLTAKWFKCRVEKFYIFMNPWFSLFKKKIGETEYGIGWVPFGGYVKISGMIDESMDKEQMKLPPQPWEFRSKPAWQRLIIMVSGVTVNLILGFLIYALISWHWGDEYIPTNKLTYGVASDSLAQSIGLKDGDRILGIDGHYVDDFIEIPLKIILYGSKTIQVDRDGRTETIDIPKDFAGKLIKYKDLGFIAPRVPAEIESVAPGSYAEKIGLRKGDRIIGMDNTILFYSDIRKQVQNNKNKEAYLSYLRGNDTSTLKVTVPASGIFGFYYTPAFELLDKKIVKYSFFEAIPAGVRKSYLTLERYWLQLKLIFSGKVNTNESLGGVISMGKMFAPIWDWQSFWKITALFSLILALMNILPIPALDGGHALFTLIEMITGRKPGDKFMEYAQMAGMVLLLGLMAYALGLDIFRLFK
ncbi:MAG TPA: RIP metalloprotease RseP [Puia sp.]|nr:RIP metalloprotease RseP [Puia sp.]